MTTPADQSGWTPSEEALDAACEAWAEFPGGDVRSVVRLILTAARDVVESDAATKPADVLEVCADAQTKPSESNALLERTGWEREALADLIGVDRATECRETERTMLDRLNRRYAAQISNGNWVGPKFFRAEHVPIGLGWNRSRICDFIAVDMHSTTSGPEVPYSSPDYWSIRAPVFHGHEVKVSRSDWLTELRDPSKAETFRRHMHFWWLVVSDKTIVRDDLPAGWGLMVKSGAKLRALVKPTPNLEPVPMPAGLTGALLRASHTTEQALARTNPEETP